MLNWKRTPWMALVALGAVLAVFGGCGNDDDEGDGNGEELVVRDGTWSQSTTYGFSGTNEACTGSFGPTVEMVTLCDLNDPSDIPDVPEDCDISQDGNEVEFDCHEVATSEGCTFTTHFDGHGTFEETTYNLVVDTYVTVSPASPACLGMEAAIPCTTTVTVTGTWLNATGCTAKGTIPVSALFRAAGRRAGGH